MVQVEPEGAEPNEVEHAVHLSPNGLGEEGFHVRCTVLRVKHTGLDACHLSELHLKPEIVEVQAEETEYAEAQHEHVLRFPFHAFFLTRHRITVVTTSRTVLDGQIKRVAEMHQYQESQTKGTDEGIPVSSQQMTNHVVSLLRENHSQVHTAMEQEEKHQRQACQAHNELTADRRVF